MNKIIFTVCLVVLTLTSCQQAKQKVFEVASNELNKQCPMVIDEVTRIDSTTYSGNDNTFIYYYTISGVIDDLNMAEATKKHMEEILPGVIKSNEELKIYRDMNVNMQYIYMSEKTQQELFRVKITPDQYR